MDPIKILVTLSLLFSVKSLPLEKAGLSDLIVGELGPDDELLYELRDQLEPNPGFNISSVTIWVGMENSTITYLTVIESGEYPEARVELEAGGPGYNAVILNIYPGPPQGFNYTISLFGIELEEPDNFARNYRHYITENYD